MAAPSGIVWGAIQTGSKSSRQGRIGVYTSVSSTNTQTTVSIQVWIWTMYSCTDSSNQVYFDIGTGTTSATTQVGTNVNINHTVASGGGWSTSNQTQIYSTSKTYNRGTSAVSYNIHAKLNGIDYVGSKSMTASTSATVPAKASYTVSYNANGGSGAPGSQTKWYGTNLTLSSTKPTRTGYSFQGWGTSSGDTSVDYAAGATYSANAGITLYAIWKANTYTVSYNANGGSGAPGNQTKTYGVTLTLSSTKPTRTNYTFKGWGTSAGSTTVSYSAGGSYTSNSGITLYAIWELSYVKPRITNVRVYRCDSNGTESDTGDRCRMIFDWATDLPATSITLDLKFTSDTKYAPANTVYPSTNNSTSGHVDLRRWNFLSADMSYHVRIVVTDSNGSSSDVITIPSTFYLTDELVGGRGYAIGKAAELNNVFEVGLLTRHTGGLYPPVLEPNTDLNNVRTPNTYVGANISSNSYSNCPLDSGTFMLKVDSYGTSGQVKQTLMACNKTAPEVLVRFYYQDSWGIWMSGASDLFVLYNSDNGTAGSVTLASSAANYRYLEIYYMDNNAVLEGCAKLYDPNGKDFYLNCIEGNGDNTYIRRTRYRVNGTTINVFLDYSGYLRVSNTTPSTVTGTNFISIYRVIGRA